MAAKSRMPQLALVMRAMMERSRSGVTSRRLRASDETMADAEGLINAEHDQQKANSNLRPSLYAIYSMNVSRYAALFR